MGVTCREPGGPRQLSVLWVCFLTTSFTAVGTQATLQAQERVYNRAGERHPRASISPSLLIPDKSSCYLICRHKALKGHGKRPSTLPAQNTLWSCQHWFWDPCQGCMPGYV